MDFVAYDRAAVKIKNKDWLSLTDREIEMVGVDSPHNVPYWRRCRDEARKAGKNPDPPKPAAPVTVEKCSCLPRYTKNEVEYFISSSERLRDWLISEGVALRATPAFVTALVIKEVIDNDRYNDDKEKKDIERNEKIAALERRLDELDTRIKNLPAPRDGRDGKDGRDGRSVSVADVMPLLTNEIQRGVDAIPKPKDGKDGVDGKDGFGLEDFSVEFDREHGYRVRFSSGDVRKESPVAWPFDAGVYKSGQMYPPGACVTFKGQYCIALLYTRDEPMTSRAWRLVVKAGRDGKPGRDGRDLREREEL